MIKKLILLSIGIAVISITSCSVVLEESHPDPGTFYPGWTSNGPSVYEFQQQDFSIRMQASYSFDRHLIWFGPPVIPVFPYFLFKKQNEVMNFIFRIDIDSPAKLISIDVSRIKAKAAGKDVYTEATNITLNSQKGEEHVEHLTLKNGMLTFYLVYRVSPSELESFVIDLGNIIVDGAKTTLPPLQFRRNFEYTYVPFYIWERIW